VSSESTVFDHVTASARFADASASSSHPLPLLPLKLQVPLSFPLKPWRRRLPDTRCRWATPQKRAPQSIPVNRRHSRRARLLTRNHVAGSAVAGHRENLSIFVRSLLPFCLDRCLACSVLCRVYIPSRPALARHQNTVALFPSRIHTHTHTLSLTPPLSQRQRG
jgi:hypothetical protein